MSQLTDFKRDVIVGVSLFTIMICAAISYTVLFHIAFGFEEELEDDFTEEQISQCLYFESDGEVAYLNTSKTSDQELITCLNMLPDLKEEYDYIITDLIKQYREGVGNFTNYLKLEDRDDIIIEEDE